MSKFALGQIVMTRTVNDDVADDSQFAKDIIKAMKRYRRADFSDMAYEEDIQANRDAIEFGNDRIFATYNTSKGKIYIITERDRSATTILYPHEY